MHRDLIMKFTFSALLFSACSRASYQNNNDIIYDGKISNNFLEFTAQLENDVSITVSSSGGHPAPAYASAMNISKKNVSVRVSRLCASACAEYILPAAKNIEFIEYPIVGFHGNPIMGATMEHKFEPEAFKNFF